MTNKKILDETDNKQFPYTSTTQVLQEMNYNIETFCSLWYLPATNLNQLLRYFTVVTSVSRVDGGLTHQVDELIIINLYLFIDYIICDFSQVTT